MSPAPTHRRSKSPRPSVAYTMSLRHVAPVGNGLSDNVVCDSRRLNTPLTNTTGCQSPGRLLQPTDRVVMIRSGVPRPVFSIWSSGSVEKPFKIIEKGAPGAVERPAQGDQHGDVGHVLASLDRGNPASAHVRPFSKLNARQPESHPAYLYAKSQFFSQCTARVSRHRDPIPTEISDRC